jgi:hypothetical protein
MLEESFWGLDIEEIRKLAFDLEGKYELPHTLNQERKFVGGKWFYAFMRKNLQLSVLQTEVTPIATTKCFNMEHILYFLNVAKQSQHFDLHLTMA